MQNRFTKLPGSCPERFKGADKRLPLFTETRASLSVDIVWVEFNLIGLPDSAVYISGFRGEDGRLVECATTCYPHSSIHTQSGIPN
jgi:hypothetical protein